MTVSINGTSGLTFNDASTQNTAATGFGFKNRIINGAMMIDQRNAGASVTVSTDVYTLDRWKAWQSVASKYSVQQNAGSVTPPAGFTNYLGVTSLASTSLGAADYYVISQYIEGFNTADLGFGTANASTVTLSFWVRSSLTGTFGGAFNNSGSNRSYPFTYTINAANTWEQKFITVTGDTTGTWTTNNGIGLGVWFGLGVGSNFSGTAGAWAGANRLSVTGATSVVGTNGATFYITGVQLEKGSTATSFDYRPYGTELQLAQRYFVKFSAPALRGVANNSTTESGIRMGMILPVQMRTTPTLTQSGLALYDGTTACNVTSIAISYSSAQAVEMNFNSDSGSMVLGRACVQYQTGSLSCSAEL